MNLERFFSSSLKVKCNKKANKKERDYVKLVTYLMYLLFLVGMTFPVALRQIILMKINILEKALSSAQKISAVIQNFTLTVFPIEMVLKVTSRKMFWWHQQKER